MSETAEPTVLARVERGVGHLTLNRPRAINALDLDMVGQLTTALDAWQADADVELVLLDGAGERGLCAGGDVRGLREQLLAGRPDDVALFFRSEYHLNAQIAEYPKPVVALADGITMGGGIGLAGHAAVRIVTERSRLAMPETRIGFTPDVGGSWLLAHAPGRVGEYLALTGETMDADDAVYAGLADLRVPSDRLGELDPRALSECFDTRAPRAPARSTSGDEPAPSRLEAARVWIDDAFAADTVTEIIARLRGNGDPAASATADALDQAAPTALTVTLAAIRRARGLPDLRAALAQEYGLVMWFAQTQPDLVEGIRAQLVDKTRDPRWHPATLAGLPVDLAAEALAWLPPVPLWSTG
ncbi:enoyl-CoA hydratase/isomerase family protein [Microbacterium sp.]|uniref:enoyl-CoA hydratase/isomerase family protein n=1 Tax=Microbacterium sp. TaxID=51671 RepID=UPI003C70866A